MNNGDSTISRNESYENLRLRIAEFDSFKNADNIKNHTFSGLRKKRLPCSGKVRRVFRTVQACLFPEPL
jgi:hypothetical protein